MSNTVLIRTGFAHRNEDFMRDVNIAITAASYSGNKGAAAMLQSSIKQLHEIYGHRLNIRLMSVYPRADREQLPYDFVRVVPCKPERLLFIAFPLAILHRLLGWIPFIGRLIGKDKIIRAYKNTDVVIDEAGISFVDSRGFVMNTYAFVCAAVPMLLGVPVIKYSQALGSFKSFTNRFLARLILPKVKLICARGQGTYDNLKGIGIEKNVKLCADGAFTMPDDERCRQMAADVCASDSFFWPEGAASPSDMQTGSGSNKIIGLSLSSVVDKKCAKQGIDYRKAMVNFINYLTGEGWRVLIIANAAREGSEKSRNNDLLVCDSVYEAVQDKENVRWYHKEMEAEEIREYIARCRVLVASRFHAMIGALNKRVPVLLIGWSHKYQEVLDMFGLGQYAIDFSQLELEKLIAGFRRFMDNEMFIRKSIDEHYDMVMESSRDNIRYIREEIDQIMEKPKKSRKLLDTGNPDRYIGEHYACRKGYAADEKIRENAASGGMVTALLVHLLESGQIDGAWVTRTDIENGRLGYKTFIATTREELMRCSSSIYMDMPLLKHIQQLRDFDGRAAVVLTPCTMRSFCAILEREPELKDKVVLKLGLYCSGGHSDKATLLSLEKSGISLDNANRLYYRRGHWRGTSSVLYNDGSEKNLSYTKTICAYKNAYFFEKGSCMLCQDQYCRAADISFGDIWLKEMKGNPIKHTSCVIRNKRAYDLYRSAVTAGAVNDSHISDTDILRSQKRALVYKFNAARAKEKYYAKQGKNVKLDTQSRCKWNHRLAFWLSERNRKYSIEHYDRLAKKPTWFIYYYMCFIRVLLSF